MSETAQARATHASPQQRGLPTGWRWARLGELSDPTKGSSRIGPFGSSLRKDELSESGIPVIGIENVLRNRFEHCFRRFISAAKYAELEDYTVKPGDVLVSTMGTIGRSAVVPDNIETTIIDSHLFRFRLNRSEADPTFICYAINGLDSLRQQLETKSSGAIMAGLNTTILRECMIPLPPLPEQQRIAGVLREQMAAVEKARAAAQARLAAVKTLLASLLRQVFPQPGQPLPDGWRWVRLGEVCEFKNGINFTAGQKGTGVLTVDVFNMYSDSLQILTDDLYRVEISLSDEYFLQADDILIVRSSVKREGVGWPSLFPVHDEPVTFCGFIIRARLISGQLSPQFMIHYLRQEHVRALVIGKSGTGTITNISQSNLKQLMIPFPPLGEQERIAALLRDQMAAIKSARAAAEEELATINALPAAMLRRAFNGEV